MTSYATIAGETLKIISFFGVQYSSGRLGSFPYGLIMKFSLIKIACLVVISDMIQIFVLLNFLDFLSQKFKWLKKKKLESNGQNENPKNRFKRLKKYGHWGLFFIALLPYVGGALGGSILASSLKINKKKAFLIIISGCILSTLFFYLGYSGILSLWLKKGK